MAVNSSRKRAANVGHHYDGQLVAQPDGTFAFRPFISFDGGTRDGFGRLRVSTPTTLFDSKQIFDNRPVFWDDAEVSGSGTNSTYSQDRASTTLSVSANTAGRRVRQTFQRFNYQPGKSHFIISTVNLANTGGGAGISASVGYYDDANGVFFRIQHGTLYACVRSNVSGTPVLQDEVPQSEWNIDKLDGSGPSGVTLDPAKVHIIFFDMEWLGVGTVRFGFVIDGQFIIAHEAHHANLLADVYMSTPNLPLRYEIENDGTGPASSIQAICSTVISEGGLELTGQVHYSSTGATSISLSTAGTIYPLIGLRLKTTALGQRVDLSYISTLLVTRDNYEWLLLFNPTLSGVPTFTDHPDSTVQTYTADPATPLSVVTSGYDLGGGYGSQRAAQSEQLRNALRLGASIAGVRDALYLCIRPLSPNANAYAGLGWRELA